MWFDIKDGIEIKKGGLKTSRAAHYDSIVYFDKMWRVKNISVSNFILQATGAVRN